MEIGDYLTLGRYKSNAILWRLVAFHKVYPDNYIQVKGMNTFDGYRLYVEDATQNEEGYLPLFLSDKIICLKPFDRPGKYSESQKRRIGNKLVTGSPFWGDSDVRLWLNYNEIDFSSLEYGNSKPEDYFLKDFTIEELQIMKPVLQDTLLHLNEYADMSNYKREIDFEIDKTEFTEEKWEQYRKRDIEEAKASDNISTFELWDVDYKEITSGFKKTYYIQQFTDRVFLLDAAQLYAVYCNAGILGDNYCQAKSIMYYDADSAPLDAQYSMFLHDAYDSGISYWLRTPALPIFIDDLEAYYETSKNTKLGYVDIDGRCRDIDGIGPSVNNFGIRPAFYLDKESIDILSGDGSLNEPYVLRY